MKKFDEFFNTQVKENDENTHQGEEIKGGKDEPIMLSLSFGKDQEKGVDHILDKLKTDGHLVGKDKKEEDSMVHYLLKFRSSYGIYLFGYNQAKMSAF